MKKDKKTNNKHLAPILLALISISSNTALCALFSPSQKITTASMSPIDQTKYFKLDPKIATQIPQLLKRIGVFSLAELPNYGYIEIDTNKAGSLEFNPVTNQDLTVITIGTVTDATGTVNNINMSKCGFGQLIATLSGLK